MKKMIIFSVSIICLASTVFALYVPVEDGALLGTVKKITVRGSKGVMVEYRGDVTTFGLGYVMGTFHPSGTQTYATSLGDTKTFMHSGTAVATPANVPNGFVTADFSSWTPL